MTCIICLLILHKCLTIFKSFVAFTNAMRNCSNEKYISLKELINEQKCENEKNALLPKEYKYYEKVHYLFGQLKNLLHRI